MFRMQKIEPNKYNRTNFLEFGRLRLGFHGEVQLEVVLEETELKKREGSSQVRRSCYVGQSNFHGN